MLDYYGLIAVGHIGGTGPAPSLAALHLRPQVWTRSCSQPTHCTWSPSLSSSYLHINTLITVSASCFWGSFKCNVVANKMHFTDILPQQGDLSGWDKPSHINSEGTFKSLSKDHCTSASHSILPTQKDAPLAGTCLHSVACYNPPSYLGNASAHS